LKKRPTKKGTLWSRPFFVVLLVGPAYLCCLEADDDEPVALPELPWALEPELPDEPLLPELPACEPEPKDSEFWLREELSELP
jgi:hypothetical protein